MTITQADEKGVCRLPVVPLTYQNYDKWEGAICETI